MSLVVGGIVRPEDVVGRFRDAEAVAASLPHSGAVLVGDRRHGKTSLARVVQQNVAAAGAVVVATSAERETYADFVAALAAELARLEPTWASELAKLRLTLSAGPVKIERDARAAAALDDLLSRAVDRADGRQVVLFIDEVTVLARNLERREPGAGDNFLHTLRRFRREHGGRVATILSGSIGFHHVSADAPSTVNDIRKITVGPIRDDHATYLAECLLLGVRVNAADAHLIAPAIAAAAENVPYYIQHLVAASVAAARDTRVLPRPDQIAGLVTSAIEDPTDPWDLRHYRDRLSHYYGQDAPSIAKVLDVYAYANGPLGIDEVLALLRGEGSPIDDRDQLVSLVERLELDHYLIREADADRFSSTLIQRAWRMLRR
ncbi:AAA family ATPase [Mycobacterium sp. NPDC006124]|uniref:AAA family ATPase n=1 Tax=Mycobacterium sp. NPDC006124 TaxID=3156729 RepID=UPI0033AD5C5F